MRPSALPSPILRSLGLLGVLALATTGCGSFGDYCADQATCEGGNEADEEACAVRLETLEARAVARACESDFDSFFECLESDVSCDGETFDEDVCETERGDLAECLQ